MFMDGSSMVRQYYSYENGGKVYYEERGFDTENRALSSCAVDGDHDFEPQEILKGTGVKEETVVKQFGKDRRVFRVAISTTGEYYRANGNNGSAVRAMAVQNLVDISFIYEREMNVQMVTANGSPRSDYTDPETDPFVPNGSRTGMAGAEISDRFNTRNYDIGHVFHTHPSGGAWLAAGGGSGGVAALSSVCRESSKGNAWSGSFSNDNNGWISLAAHEFGHQFGANHTFNGIGASCDDANINLRNNYEMASGVTIMSYNGICGAGQNILAVTNETSSEAYNYFHVTSLEEMQNHLESAVTADCNVDNWILDTNTEPIALSLIHI